MRNLNRNAKTYRTNLGTKVTESATEITLETPKASVTPIRRDTDLAWLAADVFSTASAYRS